MLLSGSLGRVCEGDVEVLGWLGRAITMLHLVLSSLYERLWHQSRIYLWDVRPSWRLRWARPVGVRV